MLYGWGVAANTEEASFGCPAAHLLLRGLVPKRPQTGTGPRPGGWGPLV